MHALRLVPVFIFLLLLGGPVFLSEKAYAICCGCSTCRTMMGCSCPGQNGCAWYQCPPGRSALDAFQANALAGDGILDIRNVADRPIRFVGSRQCSQSNFRLKLFQDAEDMLKLDPTFLKFEASQDNLVAFQIATNGEK